MRYQTRLEAWINKAIGRIILMSLKITGIKSVVIGCTIKGPIQLNGKSWIIGNRIDGGSITVSDV
jgi:hypothetical protein